MGMTASTIYDVAVIGGGPAGAATAIMLSRAGVRVLLVNQTESNQQFKIGEGLPGAVSSLLRDLGCLEAFLAAGHLPSYGNESAWGQAVPVIHDFIRDPEGQGWHLDRVRFDQMMRCAAVKSGADLLGSCRLQKAARDSRRCWRLKLSGNTDDSEVAAWWLVDATGRKAYVSRQFGAVTVREDHQATWAALYETAQDGPDDKDRLTLIEATPNGWWYTAPIPGRRRVVAFFTDTDLEIARVVSRATGFSEAVRHTEHVQKRLSTGCYHRIYGPRGGPAGTSRLFPSSGDGWVAVGDAALALDPLSSQGIFTALYGGVRVAAALCQELAGDRGAVVSFKEDIDRVYMAYSRNRNRIYAQEQRWPGSEYWRRRHRAQ